MEFFNDTTYNKASLTDFLADLKAGHLFRANRQKAVTVIFDCGCTQPMTLNSLANKLKTNNFLCNICSTRACFANKTQEEKSKANSKSLEKRHRNYIEKYGSIENGKKAFYQKHQETMAKNYGISNVFQLESVKEKIKQTNLDRYGTESAMSCPSVKMKAADTKRKNDPGFKKQVEKLNKTFTAKYGCHPSQLPDAKCFEAKNKNWLDKLFATGILEKGSLFEYHKLRDDSGLLPFNLKCPVCKNEFQGTLYGHIPSCPVCHPYYQTSKAEQELADFIRSNYTGSVICNDRSIIAPKELDLYLPDLKLAIEYDGIYWHADDPKKQIVKTELCESKGIRLIHVFENEWLHNKPLVKNMLLSFIQNNNIKVYARKCELKEVSKEIAEDFCNKNHIQGYTASSVRLGLFYQDNLVQIMTFGKSRFNKNYEWEIVRECSDSKTTVVGGKSKLFKHFEKMFNPKSVISYCDRRYFTGKSYLDLGMQQLKSSVPSYWYIKNTTCLSRYQCQKHKLKTLLPNFDNSLSETDNMLLAGYHKVYDCGNLIFAKLY